MSLEAKSRYAHNFVSQDQLNALLTSDDAPSPVESSGDPLGDIADFIDTDEIDRLLGDDPDPLDEDEPMSEENSEESNPMDEELSMVSMEDIERLLAEEFEEPAAQAAPEEPEMPEPVEELSLEEVLGSGDEVQEAPSDGDVISQEDIERLLQSSGAAEEESPGDDGFQISRNDIESLLAETTEEEEEPQAEVAPKVTEEPQEIPEDHTGQEQPPSTKKRKRILFGGAGLVLLVAIGAGTFLFLEEDPAPISAEAPISQEAMLPVDDEMMVEPMVTSRLDHFIIPAPEKAPYALLTTDVVITIRGIGEDPLTGYTEFYRKNLFEAFSHYVANRGDEKPVRGELREMVKNVVGSALPEGVIESVLFENYRLQ